jgi:hypothetical protein
MHRQASPQSMEYDHGLDMYHKIFSANEVPVQSSLPGSMPHRLQQSTEPQRQENEISTSGRSTMVEEWHLQRVTDPERSMECNSSLSSQPQGYQARSKGSSSRLPPEVMSWLSSLSAVERHNFLQNPSTFAATSSTTTMSPLALKTDFSDGKYSSFTSAALHADLSSVNQTAPNDTHANASAGHPEVLLLGEIQASRDRLKSFENERIVQEQILRGEQSRIESLEKMVQDIMAQKTIEKPRAHEASTQPTKGVVSHAQLQHSEKYEKPAITQRTDDGARYDRLARESMTGAFCYFCSFPHPDQLLFL